MGIPGEATVQRDHYSLVPGMTAYRASQLCRRTIGALTVVWVAIGVGAGLLLGAKGRDSLAVSDILLLVVVAAAPMAVVLALLGLVARRDRAEAAAGYTTQTSGRISFDQVDPATGTVIRRAHSAVLTLPGTVDAGAGPSETYFPVPPHGRRAAVIVYAIAAALFVGILAAIMLPLALTQPDASDRDALLLALVAAVVGVTVFVALIIMLGMLWARARLRLVAAVRPGDTLFLSPQTPELRDALKAAGVAKPRLGLGGRFVVSVGVVGIQLWKGRPDGEPRVSLPWDRIDHIQAGTLMVAAGRSRVAYRTAHIFLKGTPQPIDVPLPIVSPLGQSAARAPFANDVLGSLARFVRVDPAARVAGHGGSATAG